MTILLVLLVILFIQIIKVQILLRKIRNFKLMVVELGNYFLVYKLREIELFINDYSYDTVFSITEKDEKCNIDITNCSISQKQLIDSMYNKIEKLDNSVIGLPEDFIKDYLEFFYELRKDIRTEKLINENTTF